MVNKAGFNINGQTLPKEKRDYLINVYKESEPTTALVMLNPAYAVELHEAMGGETRVCHRFFANDEHDVWKRMSPAQYVDRELAWFSGHPEIYRHILNEPTWNDDTELRLLIKWLCDVVDEYARRGYGAVVGNFSVAVYSEHHIEGGLFDPLLKTLARYPGRFFLGLHEYSGILMQFGVGQWSFEQLKDRAACQKEHWPKPEDLPIDRWAVEINGRIEHRLPPYWLILRCAWFLIRAREQSIGLPYIWITEWGWDALSNMADAGIYNHFKSRYGASGYPGIRGVQTLRDVFKYYFPMWMFFEVVFEQLKWQNAIYYDPHIIGYDWFSATYAPDWKLQAGVDYTDETGLHRLLPELKKEFEPVPTPIPNPVPGVDKAREFLQIVLGKLIELINLIKDFLSAN